MKPKVLLFNFLLFFLGKVGELQAQAVAPQDSLALVDLYNSTNGPGWLSNYHWSSGFPVSTWSNVFIENGRVSQLQLSNNRLVGSLPASLGNLTGLVSIDLSHNKLSGALPVALNNLPLFSFIILNDNRFTFGDLEPLNYPAANHVLIYSPQEEIPLHQAGAALYVATGGSFANNVYKWYDGDILISTKTGDSTFVPAGAGNFSAEITNPLLPNLTLYSYSNANLRDSLALVDLYNSTNGAGWKNHADWLTTAPIGLWYGVTQTKGRVRKLDISYNDLDGTLPSSIADIDFLNGLYLNSNNLRGAVPASVGNLKQLTDLVLYNNLFTDIPATLGDLPNLSYLDLSDNRWAATIPLSFGNLSNLKILNLGNNLLSGTIPDTLGRLSNLKWLVLPYNQLTGNIPTSLTNLSYLTDLSLNNNQLSGTIPDSLAKNTKLVNISLNNNHLTGRIPDSLQNITELRHFYLNDNSLSGPIPASLNKLTKLIELKLENNMFTFDGMEALPATTYAPASYAPQANIPLKRKGNLVYVSAGGTLTNNTFRLYKNAALFDSKLGDSTFVIASAGNYYINVNNNIATLLTLSTNPTAISGLMLADTTVSVTQTINGLAAADVQDTPYYKLVLTVTPLAGVNALTGDVLCKVTIDPVVASYNNQPYVQRHYDIVPAVNPATATATVKLYFTQADFDNFNASPAHGADLPTGPADAAGIANLRVYQYHGFSTTSLPGSYSGPAVEIDPADANIAWNNNGQYWEVSFDVNGFSGFFVSSLNSALLPVKLVSFSGKLLGSSGQLQWITANENNSKSFELQRSLNGINFTAIVTIPAAGTSTDNLTYQYTDKPLTETVYYYRLKMIDRDGHYTYSSLIRLNYAKDLGGPVIYPNPAKEFIYIKNLPLVNTLNLNLMDMSGRILRTYIVQKNSAEIKLNIKGLAAGIYQLLSNDGGKTVSHTIVVE
jgi:Leucine-rich repeat (LRR) protein